MGSTTKPLLMLVGNIDKGFDKDGLLEEVRKQLENVIF